MGLFSKKYSAEEAIEEIGKILNKTEINDPEGSKKNVTRNSYGTESESNQQYKDIAKEETSHEILESCKKLNDTLIALKNENSKPVTDTYSNNLRLINENISKIKEKFEEAQKDVPKKQDDNKGIIAEIKVMFRDLYTSMDNIKTTVNIMKNGYMQEDMSKKLQGVFDEKLKALEKQVMASSKEAAKEYAQIATQIATEIKVMSQTISQNISSNLKGATEPILSKVKDTHANQEDSKDTIEKIEKQLKEISESVDTTSGKLNTIGKIDEIEKLLKEKGAFSKQEFLASNLEDESICEMSNYGEEILKQLTLGARLYARNRDMAEEMKRQKEENEKIIADHKAATYNQGFKEGKESILESLVSEFEDLDKLVTYSEKNTYADRVVSLVAKFLLNNDLEEDPELKKGDEIDISPEICDKYESKASFQGYGSFRVLKPCYMLNGKVYIKAEMEKITILTKAKS